jgi:hypothetical protein
MDSRRQGGEGQLERYRCISEILSVTGVLGTHILGSVMHRDGVDAGRGGRACLLLRKLHLLAVPIILLTRDSSATLTRSICHVDSSVFL